MIGGWGAGSYARAACLLCTSLLCTALLSAAIGCRGSGDPLPATGPDSPAQNLLLITIDTLRSDRLSANGHPALITPHLDALSRRGTLMPAVVTPANTTLPAHASLLTSLPPEGHGGFGNGMAIRQGLPTLAQACRSSGMTTAALVSSWVVGTSWNLGQGFDDYVPLYQTERRADPSRAGRFLPLRAADTSRAACCWLRHHAEHPFMLWLHYMDPHQSYDPPPPFSTPDSPGGLVDRPRTVQQFLELHQEQLLLSPRAAEAVRTDYSGEVRYTDRCIGEVLLLLRDLGLEENTLVVVAADHGEGLNEKDCYFGHALSLAEAVNRVPLILAGPRVGTGVLHLPATLLDAAPTILSLLGIAAPDGFQGRDLSRFLPGPDSPAHGNTDTLPEPLLFTRGENGRRAWLVNGLKATFDPEGRITTLHDLEHDPLESHDLLQERPRLAEDLARSYMVPHTELAAMATEWAEQHSQKVDAETARKLEELGYVKE